MQYDRSNTVFVCSACANWLDPVRRQQPLERDSAPTERCVLKGAARKAIVSTITSPAASVKQPTVSFASLKLAPAILDALVADGYEFPTPIQAQAIPPALDARDVLGIAQTGTGKTAAFALPILNRLLGAAPRGAKLPTGRRPKALVLAPTRELAAQIAESFASYGRHTPIRFAVIFGGVGQGPQVRALQQGIDILVATPGRLIDLLDQRLVNLSEIEFFVLDEADRMLDMGFIEPIRRIAKLLPTKRQTMLFSATMPKEIRHLADSLLNQPVTVTVTPVSSAVDRIDQKLYFVLKAQKTQLLVHLFDTLEMERTVVFTKTKHGADRLTRKLKAAGIHAEAIHGDKAQNQRVRALDAFRSGRSSVLVATDVAARGLDIDDITHVVNYDLPMEPEAYVHRIGRTARAGKSGHAIAFCDVEEKSLLKQVERLIKFEIPRERVPDQVPKSDEAAAKSGLAPKATATDAAPRPERPQPRATPQRSERTREHTRERTREHTHERASESPRAYPREHAHDDTPRVKPRLNASGRPIPPAPRAESLPQGRPQVQDAGGRPSQGKPAQSKPTGGPPKHGGPSRFGKNPFGSGKPGRGSGFKGGTGFKGPRPSR
jgi:ATP-dependent RNA helicase RhlE